MVLFLTCLIIAFVVTQIGIASTTIYLHRALSHKAIRVNRGLDLAFRSILWITTGIRRQEWVAVHRKHHAYTDVEGDPHSPVLMGYWQVQLFNLKLYRNEAANPKTLSNYTRDLPEDAWDRLLFRRSFVGLGIGVAILVAVFGWEIGLIAAALHMVLYIGLSAAVNAVGHTFGKRPANNLATNNNWLAVITYGEGLHNNHHDRATSAKLSRHWYDFDPGWWTIWVLSKFRLVKIRTLSSSARNLSSV